jgi:hypothetical protein
VTDSLFADPPFDPEVAPYEGDEHAVATWMLDYHRRLLLRKVDGVGDADARRTTGASDLTLLGLVRHMAFVEQFWFGHVLLGVVGASEAPLFDDPDDHDRDFHPLPDDTLADALVLLHAEIRRARTVTATTTFDTIAANTREGRPVTFRWIMIHLIEEYARHCGHADLLREAIDGTVGD